jgi:hypothetical protein
MRVFVHFRVAAILVLCISVVSEAIDARPAIIHEDQRVTLPDQYFDPSGVCLVGDDLLVSATRPSDPDRLLSAWAVVRFARQANGEWQFIEELAAINYDDTADIWIDEKLACDGPIVGFSAPYGRLGVLESFILERTPSGWVATSIGTNGSDVAVYGDSVAFARASGDSPVAAAIYRKDASGAWTDVRYATGRPGSFNDVEREGPPYTALASSEFAATGLSYYPAGQTEEVSDTQVFDLINGSWQLTDVLPGQNPVTTIGNRVALLLDSWTEPGDVGSFFTRDASGAWTVKHTFLSDEAFSLGSDIVIKTGRAFAQIGQIAVFREEGPRRYRHEATLIPSDDEVLNFSVVRAFSVDGERVAAVRWNADDIYLFEIPQTLPAPQRIEETFEDNTATDWSVWGASDWRIVSSGGSRVYRQLNTQGGARAILETSEGTDQSIQADVRIQSGAGPAPWAGLMVRYTDPQNFYYLLIDKSSVQIRRIVNGAFGSIATAPFNLVLGRTYRFRLEAIGERIQAFVNGELVAEVIDGTHAGGKAGLTMWRSVTEYDNVVVTSSPQVTLFEDSFDSAFLEEQRPWASTPADAWSYVRLSDTNRVYRQSMTTRSAHAINGGPTGDQMVAAKVQPRAFNASGRGSVGLILRYIDYRNFYYARLTDANTVILGMQLNGSHRTIDQAPLTVNPNTIYNVRAEAIGSSLRVYVNERLVAEGQDGSFPSGRYGLLTFEASADFNDFKVIRP